MNRDRIEGNWKQLKGIAMQRWGRLTADYAGVVAGKRQHRLGKPRQSIASAGKPMKSGLPNGWRSGTRSIRYTSKLEPLEG
jgi:uncharacterized protein YjbJ (UPF0337 family)